MRSLPVVVLCLILAGPIFVGDLALWAQEKSADWPQFRGPGGRATSANTGLPLTWSATENLVWKTALPGPGASSPIVGGDRIFVTCYSGYGVGGSGRGEMSQLKLHVVCVDRDSGRILWDRNVTPRLPEQTTMREDHGYASSTPAADTHRVYAFCAEAMTGKIVYEERIERAGQVYASPVLAEGRLYYVSRSGRAFVVAAAPRYELLAVNDLGDGGTFNASPAVAGHRLLLRSDKFLYCLGRE